MEKYNHQEIEQKWPESSVNAPDGQAENLKYNHQEIEKKWQDIWSKKQVAKINKDDTKNKYYVLDMFPYPSGDGLHMGHTESYTASDVFYRFKKMQGFNVLHPQGFDAFGLPAENFAIKTGVHPAETTKKNIDNYIKQMKSLGLNYDFDEQAVTSDPKYFKWTQWIFSQFYKNGLVYKRTQKANWCSSCQTVIANEQVVNGECERCGTKIEQKEIPGYFFKITDFADDLINDLDKVDWPEHTKKNQRNWIGRSEGSIIKFRVVFNGDDKSINNDDLNTQTDPQNIAELTRKNTEDEINVVIVHGSNESEAEAKEGLLENERHWKPWIKSKLEKENIKVSNELYPKDWLPDYKEWKKVFEKNKINEKTVLVGHSAGTAFLLRWLTENKKIINKLILVAPSVIKDGKYLGLSKLKDFEFDSELKKYFNELVIIYADDDDEDIINSAKQVHKVLGGKLINLSRKGHFTEGDMGTNEFPELLDEILKTKNSKLETNIEVFTTRPDTLFGATYMVLAPEHKLVAELLENQESRITNQEEVREYIEKTRNKTEMDRIEAKEKTGVKLEGISAINPTNNEEIPIFIADYVLSGYGTGAIMAVPAHDERDFEFAKKYNIPVEEVVREKTTSIEEIPNIIKEVGFDFDWLEEKVWQLKYPVEKIDIKELEWHFDIPFWNTENGFYDLKPNDVIENTKKYAKEYERIMQSDLSHPIDIMENKGKFLILDGLHRLVKAKILGKSEVDVRKIPKKEIPNILIDFDKLFTENGILINSGEFTGMDSEEAKKKITEFVGGKMTTNYRLRDWSISRQRYWGCPIPIVYSPEGEAKLVPEEYLPWTLPTDVDFKPTGTSPLIESKEFKERTEKIFGKGWTPEYDTMDTFVDSSWYFLRYPDPHNEKEFCSENRKKWLPVDLYIGGAEHTYMHLLFARFFTKAMNKIGLIDFDEPFIKLRHQGMVLDAKGKKMSKSKGNVVNPDEMVKRFGADSVRAYMLFAAPLEDEVIWNEDNIVGIYRFLEKVWKIKSYAEQTLNNVEQTQKNSIKNILHKTIKKVGGDIENLRYNTAVSSMMILVNEIEKVKIIEKQDYEMLLKILSPFAPHITQELWEQLGNDGFIQNEEWPKYDENLAKDSTHKIALQVNGKVRDEMEIEDETPEEEVKNKALESELIKKWVGDNEPKKIIYIKNKIINIVV